LLHIPSLHQQDHDVDNNIFPATFQLQFATYDTSTRSMLANLLKFFILPLEYYEKREIESEPLLSDSLTDVTSKLSTLVSSACHAMDITLPWWASTKWMHTMLLQVAWKMLLIGGMVQNHYAIMEKQLAQTQQSTAAHFQQLVRQLIQNGHSAIVSKYFHHCWKHCGETNCKLQTLSRSILSTQCQEIINSISSKRTVATFFREVICYSAKKSSQKYTQDENLDISYKQYILPFLEDTIFQPLVGNEVLRNSIVNFLILSPPSSFQKYISSTGTNTLSPADQAVPHCVSLLLHSACSSGQIGNDSDSDSESHEDSYLSHLYAVASVWSEDVFVSRSDALQQQFVTEFVLYPLQQKLLSQDEFQKGIADNGESLATVLVQGVTLRLDISLTPAIRIDGMRVAEAMASLLGQQLQFDELHPTTEETVDEKDEEEKIQPKKKSKDRKWKDSANPNLQVMVDPDAEYFTDESSSSSKLHSKCSNETHHSDDSSTTSWGEECSLEPYSIEDDEEDIRRVLRPRTLQDCFAYLVAPDSDNLACDKQQSALMELGSLVESEPFDLVDMTPTLVRLLLHLEDKYSMSMFAENKLECLIAFGVSNPLDTCVQLVEEMKGSTSLGTRLEALSVIAAAAERLSVSHKKLPSSIPSITINAAPTATMSTRLKLALGLRGENNIDQGIGNAAADSEESAFSKTRRWRQPRRTNPKTTTNKFGPIAPHMIYSLFALMASTKDNSAIWGGSIGERFLSEFITTLSIMLNCASTYPSPAVSLLATDLFELAFSFHDANSVEVRRSVLLAMATCIQMMPVDVVAGNSRRWMSFLKDRSSDADEECRSLSTVMMGTLTEVHRLQYIA
jgi:hypothetical protein